MIPTLRKQNTLPWERSGPRANTDLQAQLEKAVERALEGASSAARERMGRWQLLRLTEEAGRVRLQAMINERGQAFLEMARNRDGTVQMFIRGEPEPGHALHTDALELVHPFRNWAGTLVIREAERKGGKKLIPEVVGETSRHYGFGLGDREARGALEAALAGAELTERFSARAAREITLNNLPSNFNSLAGRKIMDRGVAETACRLFSGPHTGWEDSKRPTAHSYSVTALNMDTLRAMERDAPCVLGYFCRHIAPGMKPRRLAGPGEVARAVRAHTGLEGNAAGWRFFCRVWDEATEAMAEHARTSLEKAVDLAVQINRPGASTADLREVVCMEHDHRLFREAAWDRGNAWKAWVHILNQFLGADPAPHMEELHRVRNALRSHIQNNEPWGPGNWENLAERSERWHRELNLDRNQDRSGDRVAWETLVQETSHRGFLVRAVTNGRALRDLGWTMGNCLRTYWNQCEQGNTRIFTLSREGRLTAAAELRRMAGQWSIGQVEAPFRRKLPRGVDRAVAALLAEYQGVQDRTPGPEK